MVVLAAAPVFVMVSTALAVGVVVMVAVNIGVIVQCAVHISLNCLIRIAGYAAFKQNTRVHQGILGSAANAAAD